MLSIFNRFVPVKSILYDTMELAKKLNLDTEYYFTDNRTKDHYDSIDKFNHIDWVKRLPDWRRTFQLTNPDNVKKVGLEDYILINRKLVFRLTVTGRSFILTVKFNNKPEPIPTAFVGDNNVLYTEDIGTHQLSFVLN